LGEDADEIKASAGDAPTRGRLMIAFFAGDLRPSNTPRRRVVLHQTTQTSTLRASMSF